MARILVVGNALLDLVFDLPVYPHEDSEQRALARWQRPGGNGANAAITLAALGHRVALATVLAEGDPLHDSWGTWLRLALECWGIDLGPAERVAGGETPLSLIWRTPESRTVAHHRALADYSFEAFMARVEMDQYDWLHFEGRNPEELAVMLAYARSLVTDQPLSLECEKPRPGLAALMAEADVLMLAPAFAR